jgi:hypothetical protein
VPICLRRFQPVVNHQFLPLNWVGYAMYARVALKLDIDKIVAVMNERLIPYNQRISKNGTNIDDISLIPCSIHFLRFCYVERVSKNMTVNEKELKIRAKYNNHAATQWDSEKRSEGKFRFSGQDSEDDINDTSGNIFGCLGDDDNQIDAIRVQESVDFINGLRCEEDAPASNDLMLRDEYLSDQMKSFDSIFGVIDKHFLNGSSDHSYFPDSLPFTLRFSHRSR